METDAVFIPKELYTPSVHRHFEGTSSIPEIIVGPDRYRFDEPVSWQLDITNTGDALLCDGTATGFARTSCVRCLEEARFDLTGVIEGFFLIDADAAASSYERDGDEFDVLSEDGRIDLEPLIKSAFLLEFPLVPLCDASCKGLCPVCGENLNFGQCHCLADASAVADDAKDNPFMVLKDLRI